VLSAHAFSNHKHCVCTSKVEKHIHIKNVDCKLHAFHLNNSFLEENEFNIHLNTTISSRIGGLQYNFLKNHYHLSFSLRGPPVCI